MKPSKKIIFCFIAFLFVCGLVEVFSLAALCFMGIDKNDSKLISVCQDPEADLPIILPPWMTKNVGRFIIHPYLGFIYNPEELDITKFGFLDTKNPIQKKSRDKIIIGIFGGSSAEILAQYGSDVLKDDLNSYEPLGNKEIIVLNFAIGSYKQPQQLMVLNYLLSLGGEFDYVINLDGFNELVLPVLRNIPNNVNPFFPRRWDLKVVDTAILGPQIIVLADIFKLKRKKIQQSSIAHCGFLRFFATARLISYCLDKNIDLKITDKRMQLFDLQNRQAKDVRSVLGHGPDFDYTDKENLYEKLAGMWARASKQMHDLCEANNIKYLHFIQPCQYVPDSKQMNEEELKIAFDPKAEQRQIVIDGYPILRQQAEILRKHGVSVYDLSMGFKDYKQPLYIDTFCHFGQEGSKLLAHSIAKYIVQRYEE